MSKGKAFNIDYSVYLSLMLIFIIIPPQYFLSNSLFVNINKLFLAILFIVLFSYTLLKRKLNIYVLLLTIFLFWNVFSSYFILDGVSDITNNLRILTLVLLINLFVNKHLFYLLKSFNFVFGIYIVLNLMTYVVFTNGLYLDNPREGQYRLAWLLGIENQFAYVLIPGTVLTFIYSLYKYNKISKYAWFIFMVSIITIIVSWSATAVVTLAFIIVSLVVINIEKLKKYYNISILTILYVVIWIFAVQINKFKELNVLIEKFLKKDITLSGRTYIWDEVFYKIPESLWLGFGNNTRVFVSVFNKEYRAHNMILQIVLDNGIVSLFLLLLIFIVVGIRIHKSYNPIKLYILLGIFSILIGGLAESYQLNYLILFLTLGYYIDYLRIDKRFNNYSKIL